MADYEPKYAEGEILVVFKEKHVGLKFAAAFGKRLGYEVTGIPEFLFAAAFFYRTEPGEEEKAQQTFEKQAEIVECTGRRDLKHEERQEALDSVAVKARELFYRCRISDKDYQRNIDELIAELNGSS